MRDPEVLILSGLYDCSTDLVALVLEELNVPFLRLNREQLASHRLALRPDLALLTVEGPSGSCTVGPALRSVWYRQPVFLRNTPGSPLALEEQLTSSQWMAFLRALAVFGHAKWMNWPSATYLAESKPYQLLLAHRCGFDVPATLVTNHLHPVQQGLPPQVVVKSLDTVLLQEGEDCLFTYTNCLDVHALREEQVRAAPLLAQECIESKEDIRVTVVGDELFAVRILSGGKGVPGDWRLVPKEQLEYVDICLEPTIRAQCFALMRACGLAFGAIDLLATETRTYFLEVNPTGEWGWLSCEERKLDFAIASWLAGASDG